MDSILYEQFQNLDIDTSWIGLSREENQQYFCTPIGAKIFAWDNGIHYCFINGFGGMVFAVNPDTGCDYYVYPLAENFYDFLSLVLATKNANAIQQIILWDKQQFINFINSPDNVEYDSKPEVMAALSTIQTKLGVSPMERPFEYIKKFKWTFLIARSNSLMSFMKLLVSKGLKNKGLPSRQPLVLFLTLLKFF